MMLHAIRRSSDDHTAAQKQKVIAAQAMMGCRTEVWPVAKEQKSAAEIAAIIKNRIRKPWLRVDIHPAPSGWHAVAVCDESYRVAIQLRVEKVTPELRALYDLKI